MGKYIGALLLIVGLATGAFSFYEYIQPQGAMNLGTFQSVWDRDIGFLKEKKGFHAGVENLKMVEFSSADERIRDWIDHYKPSFQVHTEGNYKLEVILDSWADGLEKGVIVQYHLIDLSSGDTIWELGRTLTLVR
ncbi:MAG: hypothetical protein AB7F59_09465 [Bdellovibrionales bacterium]